MWRDIRIHVYLLAVVTLLTIPANATDLSTQYTATLDHSVQSRGYEWTCRKNDVWRLTKFDFSLGEKFRVKLGRSQVVLGCHKTNVLWAAVFPKDPGEIIQASNGKGEHVTSVWLRFHPARVSELFPALTVIGRGDPETIVLAKRLAAHKMQSCWQAGGRPMVPLHASVTVDVETSEGSRRFYSIDTAKKTARYINSFRTRTLPIAKIVDREDALLIFDKVWNTFDREYAMFFIKPNVDWKKLRDKFRPRAAVAKDNYNLARILSDMLARLEDLHVYVKVDGTAVTGFNRNRPLNANRAALTRAIGLVTNTKHDMSWARTQDGIGYITIDRLTDSDLPRVFDEVLQQMEKTHGLILDLRFNGGGSETLGRKISGCFIDRKRLYAMHQYRRGPQHSDLGPKRERFCEPKKPWHYVGPVVVLQGRRTMSSAEAFVLMLAQCPQVTTMGDRTAGSSGNPRQVDVGGGIMINLPRWIAMDPQGIPFDTVGIRPDVVIKTSNNDFEDDHDPVLDAALKFLRQTSNPDRGVLKIRPGTIHPKDRPRVISVSPADEATHVDPITEIRIRFNQPMNPDMYHLVWEPKGLDVESDTGFRPRGEMRYDTERNEFILPVTLTPAGEHRLRVQLDEPTESTTVKRQFHSVNKIPALPYTWRFRTRDFLQDSKSPMPRVISIDPKPGSTVTAFTQIRINFDRPIQPERLKVVDLNADHIAMPSVAFALKYNQKTNSLLIPAFFPRLGQKACIELRAAGGRMDSIRLEYEVGKEIYSPKQSARITEVGRLPALGDLVASVRHRRRAVKSLAETVYASALFRDQPNWFTMVDMKFRAKFWLRDRMEFRADASNLFLGNNSIKIGSDGHQCWSLSGNQLIVFPEKSIDTKNIMICDPFGTQRFKTDDEAINELQLEYLGDEEHNGVICHRIRSWRAKVDSSKNVVKCCFQDWLINSETHFPVICEQYASPIPGRYEFSYDKIDRPLPDELFQLPQGNALSPTDIERLGDGFDRHFLKIHDGSNHRLSIRWGKFSAKGRQSSSGLDW